MTVKYRLLVLLMALFLILSGNSAFADYTEWKDSTYDFTKAKIIYIGDMDISVLQDMGSTTKWKLKNELYKKVKQSPKEVFLMEEPRPGQKDLFEDQGNEMVKGQETIIPEEAISAKADIYILPRMERYNVDSYLQPAHTEWRSREVRDAWRDRDGHWHEYYRTITYPEFIPDYWVPYAEMTVAFEWYDIKTGNLIAASEDSRVKGEKTTP